MRVTPTINVKGLFELRTPWQAVEGRLYQVLAIRAFDDIYRLGIDVYQTYYKPMGLIDKSLDPNAEPTIALNFENEVKDNVHIVTLVGDDGQYIYVPDSFIISYPRSDTIPYQHVVLSVSLGALATDVNVDPVCAEVKELITARFGIAEPVVELHVAQSDIAVTPEQHYELTQARIGASNATKSAYSNSVSLQNELNASQQTILSLLAILRANNVPGFI